LGEKAEALKVLPISSQIEEQRETNTDSSIAFNTIHLLFALAVAEKSL
jgi:hypothetical protein